VTYRRRRPTCGGAGIDGSSHDAVPCDRRDSGLFVDEASCWASRVVTRGMTALSWTSGHLRCAALPQYLLPVNVGTARPSSSGVINTVVLVCTAPLALIIRAAAVALTVSGTSAIAYASCFPDAKKPRREAHREAR
jgi:hypothetical protein